MKKIGLLVLSVILSLSFATLLPVSAAKSVDLNPELINVALDKNVSFTSIDGQTVLYQRPFVSATDPLPDNLLTKTVGDYLYLRFNNSIFLSTTTTAKSTDNVSQLGWAVIDLGENYTINGIGLQLWNDWFFTDVVVQVANSADFANPITVYSNDSNNSLGLGRGNSEEVYTDNYTVLQCFSFSAVSGRYLRVTSNAKGSGYSLFSRIEVYGLPIVSVPTSTTDVGYVTANHVSGTYFSYPVIELASAYPDATIYYTLDGKYPTDKSNVYSAPLDLSQIDQKVHLRAIAIVNGITGLVSEFDYLVSNPDVGKNVASGRPASFMNSDFTQPISFSGFNGSANDATLLTDEIFSPSSSCLATTGGMGWAVLDLGKEYTIGSIVYSAWHDWWFSGTVIQIATQADFSDAVTVFSSAAGIQNTSNTGATYILPEPTDARYIRATNNAKGEGTTSVFTEIKAIVGEKDTVSPGSNVAFQAKNISAVGLDGTILSVQKQSSNSANTGTLSAIVDTDLSSWGAVEVVDGTNNTLPGWIVIDFQKAYWLNKINVSFWHDWSFKDIVIQCSLSADFSSGVTTIFSNDLDDSLGLGLSPVSMDPLVASSSEYLANMGALGSTTNSNGNTWNFEATQARYLRVISTGSASKNQYSVYTEIQAFTCEDPNQEIIDEKTIVSVEEVVSSLTVANGSNLTEVLAQLPTTISIKDDSNTAYQLTGSWISTNFSDDLEIGETHSGVYEFTFSAALPESVVDAYGLLSTKITVDEMADLSLLTPAIVSAQAFNQNDYTVSSYSLLESAITNAIAVRDARLKTQAEVDEAIQTMTAASGSLSLRGNVSALSAVLDEIGVISEDTYTLSTYLPFSAVLEIARQLTAENGNADVNQAAVDQTKSDLEASRTNLVLRATADEINAITELYQEKNSLLSTLDEALYTTSSVSTLRTVLCATSIYADLSEENAKNISHDKATADQEKLLSISLTERGSLVNLKALYENYLAEEGISESSSGVYMLPGWVRYLDLMEEARTVLYVDSNDSMNNGNADLTDQDVQNLEQQLSASVEGLLLHGNMMELTIYLQSLPTVSESSYVPKTYQAFAIAYQAAQNLALKPENMVSPEMISTAKNALQTAFAGLVLRGNKTELAALLNQTLSGSATEYTASSYNSFKSALDEARMVNENPDASDLEITAVIDLLNAAVEALMRIGNKTELYAALDAANALDETAYDAELWTKFQAIVEYAESVSSSNNVSQGDVDHTTTKLTDAMTVLDNSLAPEKTGCGSTGLVFLPGFGIVTGIGSLLAIVGIILRRRGF